MTTKGPRQLPRAERFAARVRYDDNGCWEWQGNKFVRGGYGAFYDDDTRLVRAHRVAWELAFGSIPNGLHVLHTCDNPPCVRPDHLFLGTQADNMRDMAAKGRRATPHIERGEARYNARLTDQIVRQLRLARAAGQPIAALARELGVPPAAAGAAASGRSWRHVT